MTSYELTRFKKMVRVWKTRSLLFCLRYDLLIVFRRQNHITYIFIKTMSHDLLVQMAYLLRAHQKRSKNCPSRISSRTWPGNFGMISKRNFSVYGGLLVIFSNQEYPHTKPNKHGRIGARLWLDRLEYAPSLCGEVWGLKCLRGCRDLNFTRLA